MQRHRGYQHYAECYVFNCCAECQYAEYRCAEAKPQPLPLMLGYTEYVPGYEKRDTQHQVNVVILSVVSP